MSSTYLMKREEAKMNLIYEPRFGEKANEDLSEWTSEWLLHCESNHISEPETMRVNFMRSLSPTAKKVLSSYSEKWSEMTFEEAKKLLRENYNSGEFFGRYKQLFARVKFDGVNLVEYKTKKEQAYKVMKNILSIPECDDYLVNEIILGLGKGRLYSKMKSLERGLKGMYESVGRK